jgi:thymidylate synthase
MKLSEASKVWLRHLKNIYTHGDLVGSREGKTLELLNQSLSYPMYDYMVNVPERNINEKFVVAEAAFAINGKVTPEERILTTVLKPWIDNNGIYSGAYGPMFVNQLAYVLETLQRHKESRQAVMNIWQPNPRPQLNVPCLTQLHFLIRDNKLNCFATVRSSDTWLGLPNDMGVFALMALHIADLLDVNGGAMFINIHSAHIYEKHFLLTEELITGYGSI